MRTTVNLLKRGQKATIIQIDVDKIPLKLLEMGCLPGNELEVVQIAPFGDPIYLNVNNGSHLAIRLETASEIEVELLNF
ncbi:MAG TPA: FeoA family protein [Flavobacterium sp.]|uniref:FeoA family protein n=1 Tax=Flavobacterium sp. TaxID=239 RepID=UPI002CB4B7F8|nr:FeoA family protein [Flavobacterium sp.]MCA0348344.1 ferrous iron transport protein A [Bacteroidota bacterium]HPW97586.1 FeoA family protein [Flavobacterium sp.]HQA73306.1 FeoA family protein [Flavobacterium sp.]